MSNPISIVFLSALALILPICLFLSSCAAEEYDESDARRLAKEFHNAANANDRTKILSLVDYPFRLDDRDGIQREDQLDQWLEKKMPALRRATAPANRMEVVSYEQFLDGKPLAKRSFEKDEAVKQAEKIGFREGGVLVRCFHFNKEKEVEDGRGYYLVMHKNGVGDLKITTYYD